MKDKIGTEQEVIREGMIAFVLSEQPVPFYDIARLNRLGEEELLGAVAWADGEESFEDYDFETSSLEEPDKYDENLNLFGM